MNLKELLKQAKERGHSLDTLIRLSKSEDLEKLDTLPDNVISEDEMKEYAKSKTPGEFGKPGY
jgi:hypothetical protein